jgi:hypothetical protein
VNQLPSHSHATRACDTTNHPKAFDQGRPFVNTDALQKFHDIVGKSPLSFFSLQESRPGHARNRG